MTCAVCSAPAFQLDGACVFCRSPLERGPAPAANLLAYLAQQVPRARARRGALGRGSVRGVTVQAGGEPFSARLRKEQLELKPELDVALWVDRLLAALSRDAVAEPEIREAVIHAGWRLR